MLPLWTVAAAFYVMAMLYAFFVRPSAGMAAIAPMRRAAPIAVQAAGSLLILGFAPESNQGMLMLQSLTMLTLFWGTTIRAMARPYDPLRRTSILGLTGADAPHAKR